MGEFSAKEIEITDYIVEHINNEIFSNEQDAIDKSRLEYSLCSNDAEKLQVTKKRVAKYKSKIDKCDPDIAGYMSELVRHNPKEIDDGELRDWLTRNYVIYHYQELIEELAPIGKEQIEDYVFSSIVKSKGYSYKKIKNYIDGVCNIIHYTKYKYFLDIKAEENQELLRPVSGNTPENKDVTGINIYNEILLIINNPLKELMKDNLYFISMDENGDEIYTENSDPLILNVDKEITEPFSKLESLTSKLMETTKHSIVLEGYLKKIFKEFIETFAILIDAYDNDISIKNKYPKNFAFFCYMFKYSLSKYYDFIIEFLDDKFLEVENKIVVDDIQYLVKDKKPLANNLLMLKKDADQNNHLKSTIEDYLEEFKDDINNNGYEILVNALLDYFSNGAFPILTSKINFKRINKKRVGWALKELHKSEKTETISFDYILFAKENINLFVNETLEEHTFRKSNLYKAFTTNPAK